MLPIGARVTNQYSYWKGILQIVEIDNRGRVGRPFILGDDPDVGSASLLDNAYVALT